MMGIATDRAVCGHCGSALELTTQRMCLGCHLAGHTADLMDCPACAGTNAPAIVQGARRTHD